MEMVFFQNKALQVFTLWQAAALCSLSEAHRNVDVSGPRSTGGLFKSSSQRLRRSQVLGFSRAASICRGRGVTLPMCVSNVASCLVHQDVYQWEDDTEADNEAIIHRKQHRVVLFRPTMTDDND